jgi:hypothetical protein
LDKKKLIYFFVSSIIIFIILYGGFLYNIYIHPTEIINQNGNKQIVLFGDFKYLFKIINCNNLGFNVYLSNNCYSDYYGSFLYGPSILIFPYVDELTETYIVYVLSTFLILMFIFLTIKIVNPKKSFEYILLTLILFNPTTLFLYEKLNIDILIYVFLILTVYFVRNDLLKLLIIYILTITKFYPAIFSIIFILHKKKLIYLFLLITLILIFLSLFWENLLNVLSTLDYVSQSFKYSFSLNTLNKIFLYFINLQIFDLLKVILIIFSLLISALIFNFFINKKIYFNVSNLGKNETMFILSSSLSISLYLIFGNNFYREIYLIGTIPFLLKNIEIKFFKNLLYFIIFKYNYLFIFFPYYYNANLDSNLLAQILVALKSSLDFILICFLSSVMFLFTKLYFIYYSDIFKRK